jgi:hypothetical protein
MRDANTVYLVGMDEDGAHEGMTTSKMVLLRGNEVLEVAGVAYVEDGELHYAWEDNLDMMGAGLDGITLRAVTDAEANALYEQRMELGSYEDEDEDEDGGVEYDVAATDTGWRYTAADGSVLEVEGNADAGKWRSALGEGTYEAYDDDGERWMRVRDDEGMVQDVVRANEQGFATGCSW